MTETPQKETCNIKDAADFLCVSVFTVRNWIAAGKIASHRAGTHVVFFWSEVREFLKKYEGKAKK